MRVLVTGATGFVGGHLCRALTAAGHAVTAAVRRDQVSGLPPDATPVNVGDIGPDTDWRPALDGAAAVIHVAARTHIPNETSAEAEAHYHRINVEATRRLAEQAVEADVGRFIFVSSIKACGETSGPNRPLAADDPPKPEDAYGRTKLGAERALWAVADGTAMTATVLRPPLIYGPGLKGNLLTLFKAVDRGLPLPLATVRNKRSLISVGNLADALVHLLTADATRGRTFHIADGNDVSTGELVRGIAAALDRPARLWPCPPALLSLAGRLTGRTAAVTRVTGSLQVDGLTFRDALGWTPPETMKEGLDRTAAWYKSRSHD